LTVRSVRIKGGPNDEAVLCTADKTFTVRLAESSNLKMLGVSARTKRMRPDSEQTDEVWIAEASATAHFELVRSAPRTGTLATILAARPYMGGEAAAEEDAPGEGEEEAATPGQRSKRRLTLAELENAVQASAAELRVALRDSRALCVDGRWCGVDAQLELDVMEIALAECVKHEWPLSAVPVAECVAGCLEQATQGIDEAVVRHCLRCHSTLARAAWDEWVAASSAEFLALEPKALCRFRARAMLAECDAWPRERFMEAWREGLPSGVELDETTLEGLAISLKPADSPAVDETTIQSLPVSSLPLTPKERFVALYGVKKVWTMHELAPYVRDIVEPGKKADTLVLQFSRRVVAMDLSETFVSRW
jgi:sister chromatid cohesion protein DCC1